MTTCASLGMLEPAFLSSDGDRTTGRDGGQDSHGADQGSYQVTSVRPAGARPRAGARPTDQRQSTRPVTRLGSGPSLLQRRFQYESHTPPGEAQFDFGEATAVIAGQEVKAALAVIALPNLDTYFVSWRSSGPAKATA